MQFGITLSIDAAVHPMLYSTTRHELEPEVVFSLLNSEIRLSTNWRACHEGRNIFRRARTMQHDVRPDGGEREAIAVQVLSLI